ncbi:ATPase family AAA domain-containing protein 3-like [Tripterygium wilfordii]|uniref:ATPase family AAA domain-containing protein 3-like n=1 Tax=Tripterygium wilfordii TaxID=458696 RepID=A0A7J7CPU7_TRIWF|nr:ATPase family AAA domain-containing protein 3C [Tripterygium wilfordii]KAF5736028.1 ATPase family AAA domain-containing protein 3-like [Tripterygium wilfordii]
MTISMAFSKLSSCVAIAAAAASASTLQNHAYADSPFRFYPFSSSTSSSPSQEDEASNAKSEPEEPRRLELDPEALERGAKALRYINKSPLSKQVFDLMRKQEKTRLAELDAEKAHYEAIQSQLDIERQRKLAEEQRNLVQKQAQAKAQMLRYEDELTRKRMQEDHESQRRHNTELVKMQEESSIRKEQARRATEEQIQAQHRQTEKERAEMERETIRVQAMAEAEGRAHEAKLTEEHNREMLRQRIHGEREKWLAAINTTFSHIEGGFRTLLNDRSKLLMTVGGVTALAAGVYTSREGARVTWGYVNRILGQPSLIRESSIARFPLLGVASQAKNKILKYSTAAGTAGPSENKKGFSNIVLHPSLHRRIEHLAKATANTKTHQAPFRNMLFYGPPGTGKTMVAKEIARKSGLDYAMMTGGDVAPLGAQAVTKIHQIFDWAKKSRKGLLLFIDEADAFLCERNSTHMSEAQRSALNALLFRTGDQSRDIVLVLATNRPGDLDSAVADRIDEMIEFPLPGEEERFQLLKLYLNKYLSGEGDKESGLGSLFKKPPQKITVKDVSEEVIREAAKKTEGFSGREIAKLMASVQATVYGSPDCVLRPQLFREVVDYKVAEHHQRIKLAAEGGQPTHMGN